jgi:hypothetical protein
MALFSAGFFLTQCSDDCGRDGSYSQRNAVGISKFYTEIQSLDTDNPTTIDSFGVLMSFELLYAKIYKNWFAINTAYACSPPPIPFYEISTFIDSIRVYAEPEYHNNAEITELLSFPETDRLTDFNDFNDRSTFDAEPNKNLISLTEPPTQSDSFTFSFYYYKDGAIIDSSFTQKFYISK